MHSNNKGLATLFGTIITLNPAISMAAEDTSTIFPPPYWPLLALVFIIVVFRKQLNCVAPPNLDEPSTDSLTTTAPTTATPIITPPETANIIDLKDELNQCQASTAKGTRCKRATNLETTTVSIENKTYQLTVCKQHNTDTLKPFLELIK